MMGKQPHMRCAKGHALYGVQDLRCQTCDVERIDALSAELADANRRIEAHGPICLKWQYTLHDADTRIRALEAQLVETRAAKIREFYPLAEAKADALHKAFSQFENITVAATLEIAKDRAHSFIGWYYNNIESPEGSPASGGDVT